MIHIGNLHYAEGSKNKKKRIGRGPGSGHGGTSTQGHNGQQSRSGAKSKRFFEGGQMPLNRRIPKFGFFNRFRTEYQVINVGRLQQLVENGKIQGLIDIDSMIKLGLISKKKMPVKILGNGNLSAALNVVAHCFSNSAKQKIESAGGIVTING